MIVADNCFIEAVNSPVRHLRARVELYEGSTPLQVFCCGDRLKSFSIERVGDNTKFFGYGICQRLNVHILDTKREQKITTANTIEIEFGADEHYVYPCPVFYVSEVHRDENTNELSITAYDALYRAKEHTVSELVVQSPFTLRTYATACASLIGLPFKIRGADAAFDVVYNVANFSGEETIRDVLDDIAEATQTIYYVDNDWNLVFRRLDINGEPEMTIDKFHYYTLKSGDNKRLGRVCHVTELGDNVEASLAVSGSTQYIRENAFWTLHTEMANRIDEALAAVGGLTINQFDCSWRGNFLMEVGDKIALTTKDDDTVMAYVLDDVLEFTGALKQRTQWKYTNEESETAGNLTTLGDVLNNTFARVDKVNNEIELHAERINGAESDIAYLKLTTDDITSSVSESRELIDEQSGAISELTNRVNAVMTPEDVKIEIQKELSEGINKVTTTTGFTFDEEGLTISKTGSEMSTLITEDGMTVARDGTAMLTANNQGVDAINLHAKTYLWIGTNSRIEDYEHNRTGCFFVG